MSLSLLLQVTALVCLILAAIGIPSSRVSLGWLGMSFWLGSLLIGGVIR